MAASDWRVHPEDNNMHPLLIATKTHSANETSGPNRLEIPVGDTRLLQSVLDIVDYGMVLLQADACVAFANKAARADLDASHPLVLADGRLLVRHVRDVLPLRDALTSALHKGLQRLLTLRDERSRTVCVAIVPLGLAAGAILMLGKRKVCDDLSAEAFGRQYKLTSAEARVLKHLSVGRRPAEIAREQGVALSTVRTQIGCMREKTGTPSIGALISELARLPPLLSLLREMA